MEWGCCRPWLSPLLKLESLFAKSEVAPFQHLRHDISTALYLEVHDRRLPVLHLVEGRQLPRLGANKRELPVVPDRADEERLRVFRRAIRKLERTGVLATERGDGILRAVLSRLDGCPRLGQFCLQRSHLTRGVVLRRAASDVGVRRDVHLQVGLCRLAFIEEKRVDG